MMFVSKSDGFRTSVCVATLRLLFICFKHRSKAINAGLQSDYNNIKFDLEDVITKHYQQIIYVVAVRLFGGYTKEDFDYSSPTAQLVMYLILNQE